MIQDRDERAIDFARDWAVKNHGNVIATQEQRVGRPLNFILPNSSGEKILWRKLFDHNPLFTVACDKSAARDFVQTVEPELQVASLRWSGMDLEAAPASALTGDVVFKPNSDSAKVVLVRNGKPSHAELTALGRRWLTEERKPLIDGEWGYVDAKVGLLVEEMLMRDGRPVDQEYKFHVSGGVTAYITVKLGTPDGEKPSLVLDRDGRVQGEGPPSAFVLSPSFETMRAIAERLGAHFDFIRIDLYDLGGSIVFSELTPYPNSGHGRGAGGHAHLDQLRNQMWDLRQSWFLTTRQRGWRAAYAAALRRHLNSNSPTDQGAGKRRGLIRSFIQFLSNAPLGQRRSHHTGHFY